MAKKNLSWFDVTWKLELHCEYPYNSQYPWNLAPCKLDGCQCEDCPWSRDVPMPVLKGGC